MVGWIPIKIQYRLANSVLEFDSGSSSAVVNQPDVVARQLFEPVPEG